MKQAIYHLWAKVAESLLLRLHPAGIVRGKVCISGLRKMMVLLLLVFLFTPGYSQEENFISVSIYNFTRYIDWPQAGATGNFNIDVIGHKSVYEKLKQIADGRKVGSQNIEVRYFENGDQFTGSSIVFVGFWQSRDLAKVIDKVGKKPTLIIAEKDGLIEQGAGINFVIRNGVIRFEIKKTNIQQYGLNVGEQLINLAYKSY